MSLGELGQGARRWNVAGARLQAAREVLRAADEEELGIEQMQKLRLLDATYSAPPPASMKTARRQRRPAQTRIHFEGLDEGGHGHLGLEDTHQSSFIRDEI